MDIALRNERAKQYVQDKLEHVSTLSEEDFINIGNYESLSDTLESLINVSAMGFRGVVATAITGKYLDPNFDPLNNFYSCNPRSIFEKGIFYAFEGIVPCGKSDPLNVAKNINVLNEEWTKGKRPQKAAQAAIDFLRAIDSSSDKSTLINFFFFRLLQYARNVESIVINLPDEEWSNQAFASKITQFLLEYPESGTTPQFIVSKLLNKVYNNSNIVVGGGDESVFGTNTTSKKPADIWLEIDDVPFNLFEITVKVVDKKRLDDCIQSLNSLDVLHLPVHFVCRLPTDIRTLTNVEDNALNYKGKIFNFIDIKSFIFTLSSLLTIEQINELMDELQAFVQLIGRPVKTKNGWAEIFS